MNAAILLRQKILDLAIRGKLTKREKGDEPASALLARIVAEKEKRNAKVGRARTSAVPQPVAEEEMPFEVPKGWAWCRLRCLGEFFGGHTPSLSNPEFWEKGSVLWVTSKDMKTKYIDDTGVKVSRKGAEELKLLPAGTVLMVTRSGILRRTFPVALAAKPLTINQDQRALVLYEPLMSEYVYVLLKAMEPIILKDYRKTGTTVESILWEKFIDMPIPLPPLAEQKRIVERTDELLAAIDQYSAAMGKISEAAGILEKKVVDLAIRGKLTRREKNGEPAASLLARITAERQRRNDVTKSRKQDAQLPVTDEEKAFDLPEGWVWCRLGDVFQHNTGKALNRGNQSGVMRKYLTTSNVYWDEFKLDNLKQMAFTKDELDKCTIERGDLLVCEGGDIGRAAIWDRDEKMCIQNHLHRLRPYIDVCVPYFCYVLRLYKVTNRLQGKGIGLLGFSSSMVHDLIIPLPPLAEQKRIVERVDAILSECRKISR